MLPIHEMFEDDEVVIYLTNAKDGTAARDVTVYLKDSNEWQLDLGDTCRDLGNRKNATT